MRKEKLDQAVKAFRDAVVEQSKSNLNKLKKNATSKLSNSIKGEIIGSGDEVNVVFEMMLYGMFQDQGVDGVKVKHGSPFSFKSKGGKRGLKGMPPPSALDKWLVIRNFAPRDKQGRFMTRKQVQFMLSRSIFNKGIKRSLFFTEPYNKAIKEAGRTFKNALFKDMSIYMDYIIGRSNRKRKQK